MVVKYLLNLVKDSDDNSDETVTNTTGNNRGSVNNSNISEQDNRRCSYELVLIDSRGRRITDFNMSVDGKTVRDNEVELDSGEHTIKVDDELFNIEREVVVEQDMIDEVDVTLPDVKFTDPSNDIIRRIHDDKLADALNKSKLEVKFADKNGLEFICHTESDDDYVKLVVDKDETDKYNHNFTYTVNASVTVQGDTESLLGDKYKSARQAVKKAQNKAYPHPVM